MIVCNPKSLEEFLIRNLEKQIDIQGYDSAEIFDLVKEVEKKAEESSELVQEAVEKFNQIVHPQKSVLVNIPVKAVESNSLEYRANKIYLSGTSSDRLKTLHSYFPALCDEILQSKDKEDANKTAHLLLEKIGDSPLPAGAQNYRKATKMLQESVKIQTAGRKDVEPSLVFLKNLIAIGA